MQGVLQMGQNISKPKCAKDIQAISSAQKISWIQLQIPERLKLEENMMHGKYLFVIF